jgi:hypothetical protein
VPPPELVTSCTRWARRVEKSGSSEFGRLEGSKRESFQKPKFRSSGVAWHDDVTWIDVDTWVVCHVSVGFEPMED